MDTIVEMAHTEGAKAYREIAEFGFMENLLLFKNRRSQLAKTVLSIPTHLRRLKCR